MIHTVTFNPALDYIVRLEDLKLGEVNRVNYEQILPGGKGVNVSIVLGNLGHANRALGFSAASPASRSRACSRSPASPATSSRSRRA